MRVARRPVAMAASAQLSPCGPGPMTAMCPPSATSVASDQRMPFANGELAISAVRSERSAGTGYTIASGGTKVWVE